MRHLLLALAACSASATPIGEPLRPHPPKQPSSELSPALVPLDWWLGAWESDRGEEHWIAASGAIYGIGLAKDGSFEVMIVDDADGPGKPDGKLRLFAMPGGVGSTTFEQTTLDAAGITFANPAHDFPKTIKYESAAGGLAAVVSGDGKVETYAWKPGSHTPAPELEDADRAFAADTAARKIDGWLAAFAPDGGMLRKGKRVEGSEIRDVMKDVLASGTLAWAPIASSKRGTVGFTVGKATFTGARPEANWKSTYVTIWKQQPDGAWKVWFDTGRPVNE
jgi:ketosteroid isomerase-like protein